MSLQTTTPDPNLAVLVNPQRIRSSVKRLFRNNVSEIIGECLQNSCRALAKNVAITITPDGFSIQDDGHGIKDGVHGFHTLLRLAESAFDNPTIDDQDPMGIGIASLLTHDQVEEVTFASGNLQLSLDPKLWWTEEAYYSTWFERIIETETPVNGFLIRVRCQPALTTALRAALDPKDRHLLSSNLYDSASPAQGYEGLLKITLDGKPVRTSLPMWATFREPLITTTYEGSSITIGYDSEYSRRSCIRWYGQLIEISHDFSGFRFYLDVLKGRPVNPLSPSRAGLIQDDACNALLAFVKDQIFQFVFNTENRKKITANHVNACFSIDRQRAVNDSPYFVARQVKPIEAPESFDDAQLEGPHPIIFSYEDQLPTLLHEGVNVITKNETLVHEYGLHSFAPLLDNPHFLQNGDETKLKIGQLYWRPGQATKHFFHEPGQFGISYTSDPPTEFVDVTRQPVFAFSDPGTHLDYIDLVVGTTDPVQFLSDEIWATYCPSEDYDIEPQRESFEESCNDMLRDLMGNCVPRDFEFRDFARFLKAGEGVASIDYRYPRGTFKKDGTLRDPHTWPNGLTLKTSKGRTVKLKFFG